MRPAVNRKVLGSTPSVGASNNGGDGKKGTNYPDSRQCLTGIEVRFLFALYG